MTNLASVLDSLGRYAEAMQLLKDTLVIQVSVLGPNHPDTLKSRMGIAHTLYNLGQTAEARKLYEETLAIQKRTFPAEDPQTLITMR